MSHHDDQAALEAPRDALQRDLEAATQREHALVGTNADRARIADELARVEAKLERKRGVKLPLLEAIQVASPCNASWADMVGDERVRFCGSCAKNVYNLSAMPRGEAEALVREQEGSLCVRFYRRADGTMLTADCPVGVRKKRFRRVALAVAGAGAGMLAAAFSLRPTHRPTLGEAPMSWRPVTTAEAAKLATTGASLPVGDRPVAVAGVVGDVMGGLVAAPEPSVLPGPGSDLPAATVCQPDAVLGDIAPPRPPPHAVMSRFRPPQPSQVLPRRGHEPISF